MSKSSKNKKNKVPKITEEEYAAYLSALKAPQEQGAQAQENKLGQTEYEKIR